MKTEVKFTALMAVCMALASVSLAESHSHAIPDGTPEKKLTSGWLTQIDKFWVIHNRKTNLVALAEHL
jgi:hypothetical protein